MAPPSQQTWQQADEALRGGRLDLARGLFTKLLEDPAWALPGHLRLSAVATAQGEVREAARHALAAYALREPDPVLLEALARRLVEVGELEAGVDCATHPALQACDDPAVLAGVGELLNQQSLPRLAIPLLERAMRIGGDSPGVRAQLGQARLQVGDMDQAERDLEACVRAAPGAAAAWRELSRLRRQTPERNHVAALRGLLARMPGAHPDAPPLQYALFKELDDLGRHDEAWQALEAGMRLRRAQLDFDPARDDASLFDALMATPATGAGNPSGAAAPDEDAPQPVFIVGLPRSGTTLLERILGAHPDVTDAGELRDFGAQLRWMCELPGPNQPDAALVEAAERIDHAELGRRYLGHTRWHAQGRRLYTDKLPANFLMVGLIARALPRARIVHMARAPMDACFSNLKELFGDAYPHSYDQQEMAGHYLRYRALMAHWHECFPGRIHDVSYDALVADPEAVGRGVFEFCGLEWDPAAVAVERRGGAVATASTAQVREPIHRRFVGQWRRYEAHLQPLRRALASVEDAS